MPPADTDITRLLQEAAAGDPAAVDQLFASVYRELKRVAHRQLDREREDHTLNTTALVHEAYLKLVASPPSVAWKDRVHFFMTAGRAMRQILVNYARARTAKKRGGGAPRVSLDEAVIMPDQRTGELVALDEALERLEQLSERQARLVELRYFVGLTIAEAARVLDVSVATANRDWTAARLWLQQEVERTLAEA